MSYLRYHPRTIWEEQTADDKQAGGANAHADNVDEKLQQWQLSGKAAASLLLSYRDAGNVPHHQPHTVHTTINTAAPDGKTSAGRPPAQWFAPRTNGKPQRNYAQVATPVEIADLRGSENNYTLNRNGFALVRTVTDTELLAQKVLAYDNDWFERVYYPECATIIKQVTGAGKAVIWNHTIRGGQGSTLNDGTSTKTPIQSAHVDRVPRTAHSVAQILLTSEQLYKATAFSIINLWRPWGHGVHDCPLALCDWQTLDLGTDLQPTLNFRNEPEGPGGEGLYGEGIQIKHSARQRWYYWGGQQPDEALLIPNYSSRSRDLNAIAGAVRAMEEHEHRLRDVAGFTTHTAFETQRAKRLGCRGRALRYVR